MKFILFVLFLIFVYILFRSSKNPSSGSGGLSPTGGERNYVMKQVELSNKNVTYPTYDVQLYDNSGIPGQMIWDIGHWSS